MLPMAVCDQIYSIFQLKANHRAEDKASNYLALASHSLPLQDNGVFNANESTLCCNLLSDMSPMSSFSKQKLPAHC